jgi:hypothetical protein
MKLKLERITFLLFLAAAILSAGNKRIGLLPKLQSGQSITYVIRFQSDKTVKTDSKVVAPMAPDAAQLDAHGLLRVEILDVKETGSNAVIHARGRFLTLDSGAWFKGLGDNQRNSERQRMDPDGKSIEFTISSDGSVDSVKGLDSLFPEQRQAWQQWVARFALAWTLPSGGMKPGEKWKSEQAEQAGSPIAGLHWARESLYVRDEPCQPSQLSLIGEVSPSTGPPDTCAVLLTTAKLKQKSPSKDATPKDFRLHELRTIGTARGTNETITYISLNSGLVVRATDDTNQLLDVSVAQSDGSNHVRYNVVAKSHSEVLLVTETPLTQP